MKTLSLRRQAQELGDIKYGVHVGIFSPEHYFGAFVEEVDEEMASRGGDLTSGELPGWASTWYEDMNSYGKVLTYEFAEYADRERAILSLISLYRGSSAEELKLHLVAHRWTIRFEQTGEGNQRWQTVQEHGEKYTYYGEWPEKPTGYVPEIDLEMLE